MQDLQASYEHHAKIYNNDTIWKSAIIETIREHNNMNSSPLYMKLGERKNIMTISINDRKSLVPQLFARGNDLIQFRRALAFLYLEAYGMSVFDIRTPEFIGKFGVKEDHAEILMRYFPSDDFIGYLKSEANEGKIGFIPEGVNVINIPDEVVQDYLKAARERATNMGAVEDPNLNLSGLIIEPGA